MSPIYISPICNVEIKVDYSAEIIKIRNSLFFSLHNNLINSMRRYKVLETLDRDQSSAVQLVSVHIHHNSQSWMAFSILYPFLDEFYPLCLEDKELVCLPLASIFITTIKLFLSCLSLETPIFLQNQRNWLIYPKKKKTQRKCKLTQE